jgi:hypothetical protein
MEASGKITDQAVLAEIAKNANYYDVSMSAVEKITELSSPKKRVLSTQYVLCGKDVVKYRSGSGSRSLDEALSV